MTITHSAADLRGISLANVASWNGGPSKTSQIVSFFLIENSFVIDCVVRGDTAGEPSPEAAIRWNGLQFSTVESHWGFR